MKIIPTPRNRVQDIAKALGIILVVYGHMWLGLKNSGLTPETGPLAMLTFTLYTFHMPLFFALAGYNAFTSLQKRQDADFAKGRMWSLAYPYVIWSIFQWGVLTLMASYVNMPLEDDLPTILLFHPLSQFWFLYVLIACNVLLIAFRRPVWLLVSAAVFLLVISTPMPGKPLVGYWPLVGMHFIFFALAYAAHSCPKLLTCCQNFLSKINTSFPKLLALASIASIAFIANIIIGLALVPEAPVSLLMLPASAIGIAVTIILAAYLNQTRAAAALAWLGQRSLGIFVMHILVTAASRIALTKLGITNVPALLLLGTTAAIVAPVIAWEVLARLRLLNLAGLGGKSPLTR